MPLSIGREAAISFCINGTLSLLFFIALFGLAPRLLNWGNPDGLAWDFVPQSIAVALMSALVPVLVARAKLMGMGRTGLPPKMKILAQALAFAGAGGALGVLLAIASERAGLPPMGWASALALKLVYGGSLGAFITNLALRRMVR